MVLHNDDSPYETASSSYVRAFNEGMAAFNRNDDRLLTYHSKVTDSKFSEEFCRGWAHAYWQKKKGQ